MSQTELSSGVTIQGVIVMPGQTNFYSFAGVAGESIVLRMGSFTLNPRIQLFAPGGGLIATAGSGNGGFTDADLALQLTGTGTFTVGASAIIGTNQYTLTFAKAPGAFTSGDEGGELVNGWKHTGSLQRGDLDLWSFAAQAGDSLVLRLGATNFNPWIRLYGPDGALVGQAASGNGGFMDPDLEVRATNSGTFLLVASSFTRNPDGDYVLSLARSQAGFSVAPGDEGGAMTNGWKHSGELERGDLDLWSFTANAGDGVVLRLGSTNYNPWLRLFGPDGALVGEAVSGNSGVIDVDLAARATNSGVFTVVTASYPRNGVGRYHLSLSLAPHETVTAPGDEGGLMTNGAQHTGALDVGDLDVWQFMANAGDGIVLRLGATNFNPSIRLFGPDGALMGTAASINGGFTDLDLAARATNSGLFTVVASRFTIPGAGHYLLSLIRSPGELSVTPGDEGEALNHGWRHTGALRAGDIDAWTFEGAAGDTVILRMGAANYNPWIRLYGPDGALAGQSGSGNGGFLVADLAVRLTQSGPFTAVAASFLRNGLGDYSLTLAHSGRPMSSPPADEGGKLDDNSANTGSIPFADLDAWYFFAFTGSTYSLDLTELVDDGAFTPWLRLYDPLGNLVHNAAVASSLSISKTATNSGLYLVTVADGTLTRTATGTYRLDVQRACAPPAPILADTGQTGPFTDMLRLVPVGPDDRAFALIREVQGQVSVTNAVAGTRAAVPGGMVHLSDTIVTGADGRVTLELCDGSTFEIPANARLALEEFAYDDVTDPRDSTFFSILQGAFVYTSGLIGKKDPADLPVERPFGNLGIRGDASDYINSIDTLLNPGALLETASPETLYTVVTVPAVPFDVSFDYAFLQTTGTLTVALGGVPVFTRTAEPTDTPSRMKHVALTVDDPAVLSLGLAELTFDLDGPHAGLELFLDNVVFPGFPNGNFEDLDANWFSRGHGRTVPTSRVQSPCAEFTLLDIRNDIGNILLRWPATAVHYLLESTTEPDQPGSWDLVPDPVQLSAEGFEVSLPRIDRSRFYRLRLQCP